jgi:hypothetical protein
MITKPKDECRPHAPPCNKAPRCPHPAVDSAISAATQAAKQGAEKYSQGNLHVDANKTLP